MSTLVSFTSDARYLKQKVLKKVAELAFAGKLEQKKDKIPYEIIPGMTPHFRCCVYKEREIIRERVILASGGPKDAQENQLVSVIQSACEGCPINRFRVTENCQKCMAKHCIAACPFGAISITGAGAYIDQSKCKECGRCAAACPYSAITDTIRPCKRSCPADAITMDENKLCVIKEDKCIGCGACVAACPFGALSDTSKMVDVIEAIKSGEELWAVFAPSIEGQFGPQITIPMIKDALLRAGFAHVQEVAVGADAVARHEAEELLENKKLGRKMTTSCCPAFVNLIEKHYPTLAPLISHTVSPMQAIGRYIKSQDRDAKVVFLGPCIAKKGEAARYPEDVDYVLTFEEIAALLGAKDIEFDKTITGDSDASVYGRGFMAGGGVGKAVVTAYNDLPGSEELPVSCASCAGGAECKKALTLLKAGKMMEDILEGMACPSGCVSGPAAILPPQRRKPAAPDSPHPNATLEKFDFSKVDMTK